MPERYSLSVRQRQGCRLLSYAFAVASVIPLMSVAIAAAGPAFLATRIHCAGGRCTVVGAPVSFLPDPMRVAAARTINGATTLNTYLDAPLVRIKLVLAEMIASLPVACLLLLAAIALRELGQGRGGDLARALPWLRRAAASALISVALVPLGESIRTTVVMQAFRPATNFHLTVEIERTALHLLLAMVALAVTWALAAGIRAEQDLAEIV